MTAKLCYLLGALRDGSFDVRQGKNYELRIYQDEPKWLLEIAAILSELFGFRTRIRGNLLRANGRKPVGALLAISEYKKPQGDWPTPAIIKSSLDDEVWWYVSGFWDAEGGLPWKPECATQRYISFDQKNKETLIFIRNFLCKCGIMPTNLTYTGGVWQFRITRRESMIKFAGKIHSLHESKKDRLARLVVAVS